MTDWEFASLGFRMVAATDLLFRSNILKNEYASSDDRNEAFDAVVDDDTTGLALRQLDSEENEAE